MAGEPYELFSVSKSALKLYRTREQAEKVRAPGAEYALVDLFAGELGLRSWHMGENDTS